MAGLVDRIGAVVAPVVAAAGVELFDLELAGGVLRVTIDRDGGVDLETITQVSRAVSRALDEDDPMAGRYTLEVSSPGLNRVLRTPGHFAWAVGRKVAIKAVAGFEGPRRATGTLVAADDRGVTLAADDASGGPLEFAYGDIDKARTVVEWPPVPAPRSDPTDQPEKKVSAP